ncbi:MAG: response regulator [Planctomycetota bacterium]
MCEGFAQRYRVLVADDDDGCRDSMTSLLNGEGFETFSVTGGWPVLERVVQLGKTVEAGRTQSGGPAMAGGPAIDFLVLDLNMPDLSGLEVLRRMRGVLHLFLPSILVTGEFSLELERSVREVGGFALVSKPVEPLHFRELVWELVENEL